jgi:hypothetical protein
MNTTEEMKQQALLIADECMRSQLEAEALRVDHACFGLVNEDCCPVTSLDGAAPSIVEAFR